MVVGRAVVRSIKGIMFKSNILGLAIVIAFLGSPCKANAACDLKEKIEELKYDFNQSLPELTNENATRSTKLQMLSEELSQLIELSQNKANYLDCSASESEIIQYDLEQSGKFLAQADSYSSFQKSLPK